MGKIICIMGKSATGKDTIYKRLLDDKELNLKKMVTYTTRPVREGERPGEEYFFIDEAQMNEFEKAGKIVERRTYQTVHGPWNYMTVEDENLRINENNYVVIGTPESYQKYVAYFGRDALVPVLIEVDDGERLERALKRERAQAKPKYAEMCRRFLADAEDFSEEKIKAAGIEDTFINDDFEVCYNTVKEFVLNGIKA